MVENKIPVRDVSNGASSKIKLKFIVRISFRSNGVKINDTKGVKVSITFVNSYFIIGWAIVCPVFFFVC